MTDHLPECPVDFRQVFSDCICDRLRACEQRVRTQEWATDNAYWIGNHEGYVAALDEAREALTEALNALPIRWTSEELFPAVLTIHRVFDALKEKP